MNEENKVLMERYGITCVSKMIYLYKQHKYENFSDVLRYAEIDAGRTQEISMDAPTE